MPSRCVVIRVPLVLREYNVRLWPHRIRLLEPEERNGASHLHERADFWLQIELEIIDIANLFNFDKICHVSLLIDASLKIPCTSIAS